MHDNPDVRYEKSDIHLGVLWFGVGLAAIIIAVHVGVGWLLQPPGDGTHGVEPTIARERIRLPRDLKTGRMPAPVLQQDELGDYQRYREAEENRLSSHGWVDSKAGIVHIPVSAAMDLLADPSLR